MDNDLPQNGGGGGANDDEQGGGRKRPRPMENDDKTKRLKTLQSKLNNGLQRNDIVVEPN